MISADRFTSDDKNSWDEFVATAKNGTFLFQRGYMEYHAGRFTDCSIMFRSVEGRLIAALPANIKDDTLYSHGGLTYGGVISGNRMKTPVMLEIFETLIEFVQKAGLRRIVYKAVPHIYHQQPAEEDLYALFRCNARLIRRDVSTSIFTKNRLPLTKGRKWAIGQGRKNSLEVRQSMDFATFMRLEIELLAAKYNTVPVHTDTEIELLAGRFPQNIKLFAAFRNEEMLAGTIIYESAKVAHAQYIAASDAGKEMFALDAVLQFLITDYYAEKPCFDFGISTEQQGRYLNVGLVDFKESWGGRATVYDSYEIEVA